MKRRILGRTGLEVSEITLGTWGLAAEAYGTITDSRFEDTIRGAVDAEVNAFDMAPLWGDGRAERIVGAATKERRDDLLYITRAGAVKAKGSVALRFDRESLVQDCHASLERLGTDRIDVLLLHNAPETVLKEEDPPFRKAMDDLKKQGKIRAWGASVGSADEARMAMSSGAEVVCLVHNLLYADEVEGIRRDLKRTRTGLLVRSPLAYGMLSGRWSEHRRFMEGDHRHDRWRPAVYKERLRQVGALRFLVRGDVRDMATAALRYVMATEEVTSALVGARTAYHIRHATDALDAEPYMEEVDLERIPQVRAAVGA